MKTKRMIIVVTMVMTLGSAGWADQTVTGDLFVTGNETIVGDTTRLQPYSFFNTQNNRIVTVRNSGATSSNVPYTGFLFANNQTGGANNIAQLMFMNEAIGVAEKRLAQIICQTAGATNKGKFLFRVFDAGTGIDALELQPTGKARFASEISSTVVEIRGGSDVAEMFDVRSAGGVEVEPGMVVSIDSEKPGALVVTTKAYDRAVAGIVSGAGEIRPGMLLGQEGTIAHGDYPIVVSGRVYCQADATAGAIVPGDMLTTSSTPGHAIKATNLSKAQGAIIGKAMTPLASGKGLVLVLVTLH